MEVEDEGAPEVEGEDYPGGPLDETLLTGYKDHMVSLSVTCKSFIYRLYLPPLSQPNNTNVFLHRWLV